MFLRRHLICIALWMAWFVCVVPDLPAQLAGGGGGAGGGGQGGGGQGGGGQGGGNQGGIAIDADGLLSAKLTPEATDKLSLKRLEAAAKQNLSKDLNRWAPLRKVSLPRLEKFCRKFADDNKHVPHEPHFLAGLQRIDYVFVYPETGDLVIAGPAEGFAPNSVGRVVGITTGRPTLRLDDLLVALRATQEKQVIGCSIDPEPENLAEMVAASKQNNGAATVAAIGQRYQNLTRILGQQIVTVQGVPADTHFAQVLVEADYRMKLIAVGLEPSKVAGLKSALDLQRPGETLYQRWWFTPRYDALQTTADGHAFHFVGQRLQLLSQDEFIAESGQRSNAAARSSTQKFAQLFTENYEKLAVASPIYAELQNITDLAILGALIRTERLAEKSNWPMNLFLDAEKSAVASSRVPKRVASIGNWKRSGQLMLALIGGVEMKPFAVLKTIPRDDSQSRDVEAARGKSEVPADESVWWWD
jgi:hypothetical protein